MSFCERQQILIKFPKNQVKFRPRLEPEKERALASFHVMNSVKVVMSRMMIRAMLMITNALMLMLKCKQCLNGLKSLRFFFESVL